MRELLNQVSAEASDKWELIGIQLNIDDHKLENIKANTTGVYQRHRQVFRLWKNQITAPYTWSTIIDVLRSKVVGEAHLADELEAWVQSQP